MWFSCQSLPLPPPRTELAASITSSFKATPPHPPLPSHGSAIPLHSHFHHSNCRIVSGHEHKAQKGVMQVIPPSFNTAPPSPSLFTASLVADHSSMCKTLQCPFQHFTFSFATINDQNVTTICSLLFCFVHFYHLQINS